MSRQCEKVREGACGSVGKQLRDFLGRRAELGFAGSIGLAIVCVAFAAVVRELMASLGSTLPFATFFPAVLASALFGGTLAGLFSIFLSVVVVWCDLGERFLAFAPLNSAQMANFGLFAASSLFVVWLAVTHRKMGIELERKQKERALLVGEIEHRGKNTLAVMASLINQTVSDQNEAHKLLNRLRVVADTNDLHDGDPHASALRSLLVALLQNDYGSERILLNGPDVELNSDQARALRMVFHEMATNALKYGALSEPAGRIKVNWTSEGRKIVIVWCEMDGPKASAPSKYNFGSKLITASLKQMNAEFEPTFEETGYCYRIAFDQSLDRLR